MLYKLGEGGGQVAGNDALPTRIQTSLGNLTRDKSTDLISI